MFCLIGIGSERNFRSDETFSLSKEFGLGHRGRARDHVGDEAGFVGGGHFTIPFI